MAVDLSRLPVRYGALTRRERRSIREEYSRVQGGRCLHCGLPLADPPPMRRRIDWRLFPKGFLENPVHLHHDHETGLTIGAVHAYCNAVLWQYARS